MQLDSATWLANYGLLTFEILGVLAFALSGLIEAARKRFDIVGIVFVAAMAAFGGGTLRDILLDRRPFFWVENEIWVWVLLALALLVPLFFRARHIEFTTRAMQWPDAVGLGVFAAAGTQIALDTGSSFLIATLMGVTTAVFGGVLRDVLVNEIPRAFNDHSPYSVIAFIGSWAVIGFNLLGFESLISVMLGSVLIVLLRVATLVFGWRLPAWRL